MLSQVAASIYKSYSSQAPIWAKTVGYCIHISPVYTRPLIQIRIWIKVIQFLCKYLNPLLIWIKIHVLMWTRSGLHIK